METRLFDYTLPPEAIAQEPVTPRDASKLLLVERSTGRVASFTFRELPELLGDNTLLVRNTMPVLKARLRGERVGGGAVECLLVEATAQAKEWWCLLKPGKKLPVGARFGQQGRYGAEVKAKADDGLCLVQFQVMGNLSVHQLADAFGETPLPPYIHREAEDPRRYMDHERYQTVYADAGAPAGVAAPTAGLHFTPGLIHTLEQRGHRFADLNLQVGLGTFQPLKADALEDHDLHAEAYRMPAATRQALAQQPPQRVLAVGTTCLRALEDYARNAPADATADAPDRAWERQTELFIYPPAEFRTGALLTNFHLPKSSLLCLVAAFLTPGSTEGIAWCKALYQSALQRGYRFYSYGDAMLIL